MPTRSAQAEWKGNLREGQGTVKLDSGAFEGPYSFVSRFESGGGTNPEELLGAAHAGCFTMALTATLTRAGITANRIHTKATVHLEKIGEGFQITRIDLETEGDVPGVDDAKFQEFAQSAKVNCPLSKVLAAAEITLKANLVSGAQA